MPKRITLQPHLTTAEIYERCRKVQGAVERMRWHVIWLLAQGYATNDVVATTGYSANWVREIARRYNTSGPDGLADQRQHNPGAEPLLTPEQRAELKQVLRRPPPEGGEWNGQRVAAWMSNKLSYPVQPNRGWDYLYRLKKKR